MNEISKFAQSLLPYPIWIRVVIIICIIILFLIFSFYPKRKVGVIDVNSVKIAYVEIEKDIYQIGIIANITNLTNKPLAVKEICFDGTKIEMITRGSYSMPLHKGKEFLPLLITNQNVCVKILGDQYLKPNMSKDYKGLLPIKQEIIINYPPPFEIVFRGKWKIIDTDNQIFEVTPRSYGNYDSIYTLKQWKDVKELNVQLKLPPLENSYYGTEAENYILYNRDRTAKIQLYGYCNTNYARSEYGSLVIVRGPKKPNLTDGWESLGNNYLQVWGDEKKLKIYNSIVNPDSLTGQPLPFGKFSGIDLGSNRASPTTRCADVYSIDFKEYIKRFR